MPLSQWSLFWSLFETTVLHTFPLFSFLVLLHNINNCVMYYIFYSFIFNIISLFLYPLAHVRIWSLGSNGLVFIIVLPVSNCGSCGKFITFLCFSVCGNNNGTYSIGFFCGFNALIYFKVLSRSKYYVNFSFNLQVDKKFFHYWIPRTYKKSGTWQTLKDLLEEWVYL